MSGTIKNEWDDLALKPKKTLVKENEAIGFQYLNATTLEEIEDGIRMTIQNVGHSILALGIAFAKIDMNALYIQAGYNGYLEYLQSAETRIGLPVATIGDYKRIGESFLRYRQDLREAGFDESTGLHKLRYIDAALKTNEKADVFKKITEMSFREFIEYSRGPQDASVGNGGNAPDPSIKVSRDHISIDGIDAIQVSKDLPEMERTFLQSLLFKSYKIRAGGNKPYVIETYGEGEQRAIENFLKKFRAKK